MPEPVMPDRELPTLFVSFSSRDNEFVRRLIARLDYPAHQLKVWIYEGDEGEIAWGTSIEHELRRRIDQCHVFVPVISDNSLESAYTRFEVEYALSLNHLDAVLPLVDTAVGFAADKWPKPYNELSAKRFRFVEFHSQSALETAVFDLCAEVGVEYRPPVLHDSRLPVLEKFAAEIRQHMPRDSERDIGTYRRLMIVFSEFSEAFQSQNFDQAAWLMEYFCRIIEFEFPKLALYYPYVVLGLCQLLAEEVDRANSTFQSLLQHPSVEESVYAALAQIRQSQSDHAGALKLYETAQRLCPGDPAAQSGVVYNRIMCGQTVDLNAEFSSMQRRLDAMGDGIEEILPLKAFAFAGAGRLAEALQVFDELAAITTPDEGLVLQMAQKIQQLASSQTAVEFLRRFQPSEPGTHYRHHVALFTALAGNPSAAVNGYQRLIQQEPMNRQYRIEAAQLLLSTGQRKEAQTTTECMVNGPPFPLPQAADDFWYDAIAQTIHDRHERAAYDCLRSGRSLKELEAVIPGRRRTRFR